MPVAIRNERPPSDDDSTPDQLRAYVFHGLDLSVRGGQANCDCPLCGVESKFTVQIETGKWRCFVCGGGLPNGGGNPLTFLRVLHATAISRSTTQFAQEVAADRKLCNHETVTKWGVCQSPICGSWLIPGYGADGQLDQLYRRVRILDKGEWVWKLLPTPGVWPDGKAHALHMPISDFQPERASIDVFEGPWDGCAAWEVKDALQAEWETNVVSAPGCNVWRSTWTEMCRGKHIRLWYDSDHPRDNGAKSGYDGVVRVVKKLSGIAKSVEWLRWGPDGHDPEKPTGYDVRDYLIGAGRDISSRSVAMSTLLLKVEPALPEWFTANHPHVGNGTTGKTPIIEARTCTSWQQCLDSWRDAMFLRRDLVDTFACMLAVCASTKQGGNQLFFDVVGSAGSGKTTLCDGLLVSEHCHHLEHFTGFHSGHKMADERDKDCSLIARINGKTLITPEFDILRTSPKYAELMGQSRRIFDGKSGATYKNSDEDTLYSGLRTPWIRAGTPTSLMDSDQSQLGDRFIRAIIGDPDQAEKRAIIRRAIESEERAMAESSNGTAGSILDPEMRKAHALTGGYVNWLRANVETELSNVQVSDQAKDMYADLAELTADLRARPNEDKRRKDAQDCKELPTRLGRQYDRLGKHLAVVLNKQSVDDQVLSLVRKIALDTACGHSLNICKWLVSQAKNSDGRTYQECGGLYQHVLHGWLKIGEERANNYLAFLRKIDVLELRPVSNSVYTWVLTDRMHELFLRVMRG